MSTAALGLATDTPAAATPTIPTRRRAPIRITAGLLMITLGFVVGAVLLSTLNQAVEVLAVARTVPAGTVLTDADLTTVTIVADTLHVIPATRRAEIIGQTAATPLIGGSLLIAEHLGAATDPGPGQSHLAVGVKPGRTPAGLAAGATVMVLIGPDGSGSDTHQVQAPAVVRHVEPPDNAGLTVVTVQMRSDTAMRIASAPGDATLVVQGR